MARAVRKTVAVVAPVVAVAGASPVIPSPAKTRRLVERCHEQRATTELPRSDIHRADDPSICRTLISSPKPYEETPPFPDDPQSLVSQHTHSHSLSTTFITPLHLRINELRCNIGVGLRVFECVCVAGRELHSLSLSLLVACAIALNAEGVN